MLHQRHWPRHGTQPSFDWIEMSTTLNVEGLELYPSFFESYRLDYPPPSPLRRREQRHVHPHVLQLTPTSAIPTPDALNRQMDLQRQNIQAAAVLGCQTCRVLSGQKTPATCPPSEEFQQVISCINTLLPPRPLTRHKTRPSRTTDKDGALALPRIPRRKQYLFLQIIHAINDPRLRRSIRPLKRHCSRRSTPRRRTSHLQAVKHRVISMHASDRFLLLPGHTLDELRAADWQPWIQPHPPARRNRKRPQRLRPHLHHPSPKSTIKVGSPSKTAKTGLEQMKRSGRPS